MGVKEIVIEKTGDFLGMSREDWEGCLDSFQRFVIKHAVE